jgi:hypothetical protein
MRARPSAPILIGLLALTIGLPMSRSSPAVAASSDMVISQVYGGGGNSGAPYNSKFVELFNRGGAPASLAGWSIQYASATGTASFSAAVVALPAVSVPAGGYYLVQLAVGANGEPLPAPDASGTINPAATSGKVILASAASGLACNGGSTPCTSEQLAVIVDLVGYGSANFYEGTGSAPTLSNTSAALRADGGCTDTDDNAADFSTSAPAPRNSSAALHPCIEPTPDPTQEPTPEPTLEPTPEPTPTDPADPLFEFRGFAPPVNSAPSVNLVKAGSAVPISFSLGGYFGLEVVAGGAPSTRAHTCQTVDDTEPVLVAEAAGGSGLSYDATSDSYTYDWKTAKAWAGTCHTLVLALSDGSRHAAEFSFR